MGNKTDGKALSASRKPWPPLPQKVQVLYNGQMKEMTETRPGQWETDSWTYIKVSTFYDPIGYYSRKRNTYAVFQLTLKFYETSFAEGERQVLTNLSKLLDTQSMADVTFILNNEKIGAHSAIVVSASPVICAMLENGYFEEGRTKTVKIDDIDPLVFKEMLRYLYTGRAPKLDEDAMTEPLFLAADKYQIEALKNCCEQRLIKKLNVKSVVHYLVVAYLYIAPQLLEASLMLMEINKKEVKAYPEWKELNKNYPDLFFQAANRMIG
jgi:speckle-type POZ protein